MQFSVEVTNRFTALESAVDEVTPEDLWKGNQESPAGSSQRNYWMRQVAKEKEMDI